MKVLVDTQALIWFVDQDHWLGAEAHAAMVDPNNDLLLSAATLWEIAIKVGLKKLALTLPYREWMSRAISDLGATLRPINVQVSAIQAELPWHHRDPFDRLIIAQAIVDEIPIVSADSVFDQYPVTRIWGASEADPMG